MQELNAMEVEAVSGGGILDISSAFGHLGRAFAFGWAIGTFINNGDMDKFARYEMMLPPQP